MIIVNRKGKMKKKTKPNILAVFANRFEIENERWKQQIKVKIDVFQH